jgi:hypothetical protein
MIVSFQGSQQTPGQRRDAIFREKCQPAFLNTVLAEQVAETLRAVEVRKEQGIKPDQIWFRDYESFGTCSVAEWMGY